MSIPVFPLSDLSDPEMIAAVVTSVVAAGLAGWLAADRLHLIGIVRAAGAGVGAASVWITCIPSMVVFGSLTGGLYALLGIENDLVGKTFVVVGTAIGCAIASGLACLGLFALPAVFAAARERARRGDLSAGR